MEKVWLKSYQQGVEPTISTERYPSLMELFEESFLQYTSRPSFSNMGVKISYGKLDALSVSFAAYLQRGCGLKPGARIAIMMPNLLQYPVAVYGALRAGMTVVNVNPLYTARELEHVLNDSGAEAIVILANFANTLEKVVTKTQVKHVFVTEIGDMFPFVKRHLVNNVVKHVKKMVPQFSLPGAIKFRRAIDKGRHLIYTRPSIKPEDTAFLQYTGGTTGLAKGAVLSHRNMVANVLQANEWLKPFMAKKALNGGIITALPLYHIFSLTANCLLFLRFGIENILITNPRDIPGFVKILRTSKFCAFTGVNTLFNALMHNKDFADVDFSNLVITLGGGMAVQQAVAQKWKQVTGVPLIEAYGLTEASPAVCINPLDLVDYNGCIGLPIPSTEIKIIDENGQELGFNEPGELCVKGPQVMSGYWNNEEETRKVFTEDGWLRTGDVAVVNEEGFVKLVDRKKDMIIVSGFNVYPNEIEDVIAKHPDVKEVAVIGVPCAESGEKVKAFVVLDRKGVTEQEIRDFSRKELTNYKVPKEVEFRDELPKTNVGKVLRRALRDEIKDNN